MSRKGSGVLISSVIVALSVLGISAISRTFFTSTQAQECQAQVSGEACEALAASAVAEMEVQVRDGLSRADSPFVAAVNGPISPADDVVDLTPLVKIQHTERLAGTPRYQECSISEFSCRLLDQRAIDQAPHERTAVFVLRCAVTSGSLGRRVTRTVEQAHALKVVLAGPPEPFGRFGFFLGAMGALTDLAAVNTQRERLIAQLGRVRAHLDAAAAAQSGDPKERILDLLDDIPTVENATERTPTVPTDTAGTLFYGLIPDGATLDTTQLDLARVVTDGANRAEAGVNALPAQTDPDLANKMKPLAKGIQDALWAIWANQEAFKILQPSAPEGYPYFSGTLAKLQADYFTRRAHHRIVQSGVNLPGRSVADPDFELRRLLGSGRFDGIVHVVATGNLKLTGKLSGRMMIVTEGAALELENLSLGEDPLDRITVVAFGGSVTARGNNQAYIIAGPATPVVLAPGSALTGGLAMHELAPGTKLEGTITKSDRYDTGGFGAQPDAKDNYTPVLSPLVLYRKVSR